jgi:hypothetical protein
LLQKKSKKHYIFWVCVYSLSYSACNAHATYYIVIRGLSGSTIFFPHYLINGTIFRETLLYIQYVTDFLYNCCQKCFSSYEEMSEIWSKLYIGLRVKYPLFLSDIIETCVFLTYSRKILKNKISRKSVQWETEPSCPCGRTDRHDEANSRLSIIPNTPKNGLVKNWVFNPVKCSWGNSLLFRGYTEVYVKYPKSATDISTK